MTGNLGFENTPIDLTHGVRSLDGKAVKTDQTTLVNDNERDSAGVVTVADANKQSEVNSGLIAAVKSILARGSQATNSAFQSLYDTLNPYKFKLVPIAQRITADHAVTEDVEDDNVSDVIDYDADGLRYNSSNLTISGSGNTRQVVIPDSAFCFWAGESDAVSGNTILLYGNDRAGAKFGLMRRTSTGLLQINRRLAAVTNSDTAEHHAVFTVPTGVVTALVGARTSFRLDFPTITDTLRSDSVFRLNFDFTTTAAGVPPLHTRITIEKPHKPASNPTQEWDDDIDWTTFTTILYDNRRFTLQYKISTVSNQKRFEWRIDPTELENGQVLAGYTLTQTTHEVIYYVSNGRTASDQWTTVMTSAGAWTGNTGTWKFGIQKHPGLFGRPEFVPVILPATGSAVEFNDIEMPQNFTFTQMEYRTDIEFKFFNNNLSSNLTHDSIFRHLRDNFDDEYALGYVDHRELGTETTIDGDLDITNSGKLKFGGVDAKGSDLGALNDFTFNVMGTSHVNINRNTYVVQPEDHGQLIAINPGSTCIFVILPLSLWNTDYNFKVDVLLDAATNGLVRICAPNFIGRPNNVSGNASSIVKQGQAATGGATFSSVSGLPLVLRYPDDNASPVDYTNYDFLDLWHARDWVGINMVNAAGWCGFAIRNLERNNLPQNPGSSQILGNSPTTFSTTLTLPNRTITVNKFLPFWQADA